MAHFRPRQLGQWGRRREASSSSSWHGIPAGAATGNSRAAAQRRWDAMAHHSRRDGSRRQANTWASLWRGVVMGGRPVAGNLAGEDTQVRNRGNLEEEGADSAVTSWQAGSRAEMGRGQRRSGPAAEKVAHDDFPI
jgi:hypothetical protein